MRISACYIARDEEKNILQSLQSIREIVDEVIFVDTGSRDDTKNIAIEFGAQVYDYAWQDDFASARNYALDRASGDWIIFLDADEYFAHPECVRKQIENNALSSEMAGIAVPLLNLGWHNGKMVIENTTRVMRIWRNKKQYRFVGCIHEMLYDIAADGSMQPLKMIMGTEALTVCHTGYDNSLIKKKLERNLTLLYREMEIKGEQPLTARYLADCCFGLEDYELAAHFSQRALDREHKAGITTLEGRGKLYRYLWESGVKLRWTKKRLHNVAQAALADNGMDSLEIQNYFRALAVESGYLDIYKELIKGDDHNRDIFEALDDLQKTGKVSTEVLAKLTAKRISLFLAALFMLGDKYKKDAIEYNQWLALLPNSLVRIVMAYYNEISLTEDDFDAYMAALSAMKRRCSDECYYRYALMGRVFSEAQRDKIESKYREDTKELIWQHALTSR